MEKASGNLFPRSFFFAIIGKFDDGREEGNEVTEFEVASKVPRKCYRIKQSGFLTILVFAVILIFYATYSAHYVIYSTPLVFLPPFVMIFLEVINMRIKLRLNKSTIESIEKELLEKDIEVSEAAALILTEEGYIGDSIECKDAEGIAYINTEDICYMESIGHDVYIHTNEKKYKTKYRIYQLEGLLPPERFIRISNSVIIKKDSIRHIKPALSSKFYLTLTNGDVVDVTRTYFYKFKEFYGI